MIEALNLDPIESILLKFVKFAVTDLLYLNFIFLLKSGDWSSSCSRMVVFMTSKGGLLLSLMSFD